MISSDRPRGDPLPDPPEAAALVPPVAPPLVGSAEYGSWLDRMQRARTRHAAITRNLYTWSNYKNWSDQVKGSWKHEPEPQPQPKRSGR